MMALRTQSSDGMLASCILAGVMRAKMQDQDINIADLADLADQHLLQVQTSKMLCTTTNTHAYNGRKHTHVSMRGKIHQALHVSY